jgi:hypothetical protein
MLQKTPRLICVIVCAASILACALWTNSQSLPPAPAKPGNPISILSENTIFTVYGLMFNRAPILGRLGSYKNIADMEKDIQPWVDGIKTRHDKKGVIPAIHLIYAMAIPCKPNDDCLMYLEGRVKDFVGTYIEKYENVMIALDPEFHVYEGRERPGIPIGKLKASQINEAQRMLDNYVREQKLSKKKILMVHQFGDANVNDGVPFMIENKKELKTFENVDLVIDMDGLGKQAVKVVKYNKITDSKVYPFIKFRAIKVFYPNKWEKHGHYDKPPLNLDQIFGIKPAKGGAKMREKPDIVIIA